MDISGTIVFDGAPTLGALVLLLDTSTDPLTEVARTTTDASGNYTILAVAPGTYTLLAESADGTDIEGGVIVIT